MMAKSDSAAGTASWVIRERASGRAILETYSQAVVGALNVQKYEAVPILAYLQQLNAAIKSQATN